MERAYKKAALFARKSSKLAAPLCLCLCAVPEETCQIMWRIRMYKEFQFSMIDKGITTCKRCDYYLLFSLEVGPSNVHSMLNS